MKKRTVAVIFILTFCLTSFITVSASTHRELPLLVDNADLLTDSEERDLNSKLESLSEEQKCEVAIVTVHSLEGKNATEYADDFFDYNGYGYGSSDDGILLLVSMEDRDWAMSTHGYAIKAFTDVGLNYMSNEFLPYLSSGDYRKAFLTFAELCDDLLTQARNGSPYGSNNILASNTNRILISLGIGVVFAFIITGIMKSKLKSVRFQPAASSYVRRDSVNMRISRDLFLYSRIDRRAKPKNTGSGSSTHRSSSGRIHGGSRGKF